MTPLAKAQSSVLTVTLWTVAGLASLIACSFAALNVVKWIVLWKAKRSHLPPFLKYNRAHGIFPNDDDRAQALYHLHLLVGVIPVVLSDDLEQNFELLADQPNSVEVSFPESLLATFGSRSMVAVPTDENLKYRKVINPLFTEAAVYKDAQLIALLARIVLENAAAEASGVSFKAVAQKLTIMVIFSTVAGIVLTYDQVCELQPYTTELIGGAFSAPINLPFTKYGKALRSRQVLVDMINERINSYRQEISNMTEDSLSQLKLNEAGVFTGGESVLQNLMLTGRLSGKEFPENDLLDISIGFLAAGFDTTASLLTTTAYLLARGHDRSSTPPPTAASCPFQVGNSLWRVLVDEQAAVVAKHGADIAMHENSRAVRAALRNMPLLAACITEAIRCGRIVGGVLRVAKRDMVAGDYKVPSGTRVGLSIFPNKHTDPLRMRLPGGERRCPFNFNGIDRSMLDHDGFDFNPDRWLALHEPAEGTGCVETGTTELTDEELSAKERLRMYQFWGFGSRVCIGKNLAMVEMLIFWAELLRGYDMEVLQMPTKVVAQSFTPEPIPDLLVGLKRK